MLVCKYVDEDSSAAMPAAMGSAGVAPKANLGEHTCTSPPSVNKAAHSSFENKRRHHQKSKKGVSVAPEIGHVSTKSFIEKGINLSRVSGHKIWSTVNVKSIYFFSTE